VFLDFAFAIEAVRHFRGYAIYAQLPPQRHNGRMKHNPINNSQRQQVTAMATLDMKFTSIDPTKRNSELVNLRHECGIWTLPLPHVVRSWLLNWEEAD
jgi:hypothetical protein